MPAKKKGAKGAKKLVRRTTIRHARPQKALGFLRNDDILKDTPGPPPNVTVKKKARG